MPITFKILPELRLMTLNYTGNVTLDDISAAYRECSDSPMFSRVKYTLSDLSELQELQAFYDGSEMIAGLVASDSKSMAEPWEIAIISNNLKHYALLSDYVANITRYSSMRCAVLKDTATALDWLGLDARAFEDAVSNLAAQDSNR